MDKKYENIKLQVFAFFEKTDEFMKLDHENHKMDVSHF